MYIAGQFDHRVLVAIGAAQVLDVEDGVEVTPDVDIKRYAEAFANQQVLDLEALANDRQWALATGGYSITLKKKVLSFDTSAPGQASLAGKIIRLGQADPPATINWQGPSGFISIAAADFVTAAIAAADFVQSTFDALSIVLAQIQDGKITTSDQIDAYAWPSNGRS
jgi:hypothetical protein